MKILQTPIRFYPYIGGVERYVLDLSKNLVKFGNQVSVICANEPKSKINKISGIQVTRLDYWGKIGNTNLCPFLPFKILLEDFDIIHAHFPSPWSLDWSNLIAIIKNKPMILTYHNDVATHETVNWLAKIYNVLFLPFVLKNSEKIIITQPDYLKYSKFLKKYKSKVVAIPIGVDTEIFKPSGTKKRQNSIFFLGILDNFHRYKGVDYLIKAIKLVKSKIPDVKLILGGKGELVKEYKTLVKNLGLEGDVEFKQDIETNELVKLYNQSEIFVLPSISHFEGFGIVLLEAMACGTPVICTDIVGVAKDIGKYNVGKIVTPRNARELANSIIILLKNKNLREKMGKNALNLARKKYSAEKSALRVQEIYNEVMRKWRQ